MLQIMRAVGDEGIEHVRALFEEYAAEWPGSDLEAENFSMTATVFMELAFN